MRLLADHAIHGNELNVTTALLSPTHRPRTLELLAELAQNRVIGPYGGLLALVLDEHPGAGPLFEPIDPAVNTDESGRSRKQVYVDAAKAGDPSRDVGPETSVANLARLEEYAQRLRRRVLPAVQAEVRRLADAVAEACDNGVQRSTRTKTGAQILNKVQRMASGSASRPPRPDYRAADVIDAVGARITVSDMRSLGLAMGVVEQMLGTGSGGRVLEVENMYLNPKANAPDYRVVPMIIAIEVDGQPYTYELQLTTQRASVAADLEHNTIYKKHVALSEAHRDLVQFAMREAAALDQLETRQGNDHG